MTNNIKQLNLNIKIILLVNSILFGVYFTANLLNLNLLTLGIYPRYLPSLTHIFCAPFIHLNWAHLTGNAIGLSIFSFLILLKGLRFYTYTSLFIVICSGLLIWLFARPSFHVGASAWIFGLWALCIANAFYDRKLMSFFIAIGVVFFYGGMIYGLMPTDKPVSFEGHIFGAIAGVFAARYFRKIR